MKAEKSSSERVILAKMSLRPSFQFYVTVPIWSHSAEVPTSVKMSLFDAPNDSLVIEILPTIR